VLPPAFQVGVFLLGLGCRCADFVGDFFCCVFIVILLDCDCDYDSATILLRL